MLGGSITGGHLRLSPRIKDGRLISEYKASSMIDVSDGLIQDLGHLMRNSNLAFVLDERRIPISRAALKLLGGNRPRALKRVFYDGEDFELLFTISPLRFGKLVKAWRRKFKTPLTAIGQIVRRPRGWKPPYRGKGFRHF